MKAVFAITLAFFACYAAFSFVHYDLLWAFHLQDWELTDRAFVATTFVSCWLLAIMNIVLYMDKES